jgi:aminopeptidase N
MKIALLDRASGQHLGEELVVLTGAEQSFTFTGYASEPALSINRGFTAPVVIERDVSSDDLLLLAAHDDDEFARAEAMQELITDQLVAASTGALTDAARAEGEAAIVKAMHSVLTDTALDDSMRGELMALPGESYIFEQIVLTGALADPGAIHDAREALKTAIAAQLSDTLTAHYTRTAAVPFADPAGRGARKVKAMALGLLAAGDKAAAAALAKAQYDAADNMTDRQSALMTLCGLDVPEREAALADFYERFNGNALVIDKWFTLQALSLHPQAIEHVKALADHPDFTLSNPNRVRSLYMAFAGNPSAFHDAAGEGYRLLADLIIELDALNPQTAARFVPALGKWRKLEAGRAEQMKAELERIAAAPDLSRDTSEQVTRSLDG